jgi:pimeloyl-ACP methyl ester carboxylesterase
MRDRRRSARSGALAAGLAVLLGLGLLPVARAASGDGAAPGEPTIGPLISGTVVQRAGTFAWTDYAYDDRGADAGTDPYNLGKGFGNVADLIQLQFTPGADGLRVQAVLETLIDPSAAFVAVGLDLDGDPATGAPGIPMAGWNPGGPLGLERFVRIASTGTDVRQWRDGGWAPAASLAASIGPERNTMAADLPWSVLGDHGQQLRLVGLAALANGAIQDLAFVRDESTENFQSTAQANVLTGAAPSEQAVGRLDLTQVARDVIPRPVPGIKNTFLYRSQMHLSEGIGDPFGNKKYAGPYQPYVAWLPDRPLPARPPMVVFLHGALTGHLDGSYGGAGGFGSFPIGPGNIDPDAVIITPLGRGETSLAYDGPAEQDVMDAIADATRRFDVDEDRVVLTGYSLGGVGTFRLAELYPDRWAGAIEFVGADDLAAFGAIQDLGGTPTLPNSLENLRNLPFRMAHARLDELELLLGGIQPDKAAAQLVLLGYDVRYWQALLRDHLTFPVGLVECEIDAAIARGRVRNPARVTYSQEPALASHDEGSGLDVPHDRAYWVSGLTARAGVSKPGDKATVDVTSLARGDRSPIAQPMVAVQQNLLQAQDVCGPNPEVRTGDVWTLVGQQLVPGPAQPTSNGFEGTLTGVASVELDLARMAIDLARPVGGRISTDGPTRLVLRGPWASGVTVTRAGQPPLTLCPSVDKVAVDLDGGTTAFVAAPADVCG